MLGITFSTQNYHHQQQFLSKLRENNENDMTSVVWAVIVFGPACRHYVLRAYNRKKRVQRKFQPSAYMYFIATDHKMPVLFCDWLKQLKNTDFN